MPLALILLNAGTGCCVFVVSELNVHSQNKDNVWQLKPFKNDEKSFLFLLKSSFRSQDILS